MWLALLERDGKFHLRQSITSSPLTIGRAPDNILQLIDEEISRHHCCIHIEQDRLNLRDLSRNGVLINGCHATNGTPLSAGDKLAIGPWILHIVREQGETQKETVVSSPRATEIIAYDDKRQEIVTSEWLLTIAEPESKPKGFRLTSAIITLGQHPECDVTLQDPFVSRRHCRLIQDGNRLILHDLDSTNGTFIDGQRIDRCNLFTGATFLLGRTQIKVSHVQKTQRLTAVRQENMGGVIGRSRAMREIFALIERVAKSKATLCLRGESGTGKEVIARLTHERGLTPRGPFIAINCSAIPATLIEGILFGHERGAFTGAIERAAGLFEQANGGTLFLDEIGDMPLELQGRLLRLLEEGKVKRLGGRGEVTFDVRLIVASHRDLMQLVANGQFRADLFYRIFVIPITLPPLRDRREDIEPLTRHFIETLSPPGKVSGITPAALKLLCSHPWPGNVRELKNTLQRSLLLTKTSQLINEEDIEFISLDDGHVNGLHLASLERSTIVAAFRQYKGNLSKVADELGIARTTLAAKMRKFELSANSFRKKRRVSTH